MARRRKRHHKKLSRAAYASALRKTIYTLEHGRKKRKKSRRKHRRSR